MYTEALILNELPAHPLITCKIDRIQEDGLLDTRIYAARSECFQKEVGQAAGPPILTERGSSGDLGCKEIR